VLDTETTGLPARPPPGAQCQGQYWPPRDFRRYDCARVVQIAWVEVNRHGRAVRKECHVIRPDGYEIPADSTRIHCITHAHAAQHGVPFAHAAEAFARAVQSADLLVAHNMRFDMSVILAECHRYRLRNAVEAFYAKPRFDTMWEGRDQLSLTKAPKLVELNRALFGRDYRQLHDALDDALLAARCFVRMVLLRRSAAYKASKVLRPRIRTASMPQPRQPAAPAAPAVPAVPAVPAAVAVADSVGGA
jgi:DNA polymerase III subunit epsilon